MKKQLKITAVLSACMMLCTAMPAVSVSALDPVPTAPDWVPYDYYSTVDFLNTYGRTHVEDGFICFVVTEAKDYGYFYDYTQGYSFWKVKNEVYSGETEVVTTEGEFLWTGEDLPVYRVVTILPETVGTLDIDIDCVPGGDIMIQDPIPVAHYTFELTLTSLTETDELAWRPDCVPEFDDYLKENGTFSKQGNQLVIAEKYNPSTGADFLLGKEGADWTFDSHHYISEVRTSPAAVGGESVRVLVLCTPQQEGLAQFSAFAGRTWSPENPDTEALTATESFKNEDGTFSFEFTSRVFCDLNSDHSLDLADLVMLSRFLTADLKFSDAQMMIADYNGDHKVNAKDLTAIKQLLFSDIIWIDDPIYIHDPIIIDDPITVADK